MAIATNDSTPPTVLVTGGCGFIGTWVIRELRARGLSIVTYDTGTPPVRWRRILGSGFTSIPFVQGSLLDRTLLRRTIELQGVSHVIHLAALLTPACQQDPWEGAQVNLMGTLALFEEARRKPGRIQGFAYASSVAVYGGEPDHSTAGSPIPENQPETFYGAFKKATELMAHQYWRHHQVASIGIRPQVAYGPEREVGLTAGPSLAARAAADGGSYTIPYTGRIGYDYVEDVARAFVRGALETPSGANVVDLESSVASVEDIVTALTAVVPESRGKITIQGPSLPAYPPPIPHPISTLFPNWQSTSLSEGIRRTVEFYRKPTTN